MVQDVRWVLGWEVCRQGAIGQAQHFSQIKFYVEHKECDDLISNCHTLYLLLILLYS